MDRHKRTDPNLKTDNNASDSMTVKPVPPTAQQQQINKMVAATSTDRTWLAGFGRDMLIGGVAASAAKTAVAPLERVKLLLQLQATSTQIPANQRYKGIGDCLVRITREQGFLSLWRGNLTNVSRYCITQALNFGLKDAYKPYLTSVASSGAKKTFSQVAGVNLMAGALAGVTSMVITYPLDFARTRIAADVGRHRGQRQFHGLAHCIRTIVAREGIKGVYFGLPLSLPTVLVYRSAYFGAYDTCKHYMKSDSLFSKWLYAQSSTTLAGLIVYPIDTVRRRLVMQSGRSSAERHYHGVIDCVKTMKATEGFSAFYKGGLSNILRGVGGALVLVLYDVIKEEAAVAGGDDTSS